MAKEIPREPTYAEMREALTQAFSTMESLASIAEDYLILMETQRQFYHINSEYARMHELNLNLSVKPPIVQMPHETLRGTMVSELMKRNFQSKFQRTLDILEHYQTVKKDLFHG